MPHQNLTSPTLILLGTLLLVGCDRPQPTPEAATPAPPAKKDAPVSAPVSAPASAPVSSPVSSPVSAMDFTIDYACPDGRIIKLRYRDNQVTVQFPARELTLPQTISASGVRYSDETTTVWNKGRDILVEEPGQDQIRCREIDSKTTASDKPLQ